MRGMRQRQARELLAVDSELERREPFDLGVKRHLAVRIVNHADGQPSVRIRSEEGVGEDADVRRVFARDRTANEHRRSLAWPGPAARGRRATAGAAMLRSCSAAFAPASASAVANRLTLARFAGPINKPFGPSPIGAQAPVAGREPIGRTELGGTPNCLAYSRLNWLELS